VKVYLARMYVKYRVTNGRLEFSNLIREHQATIDYLNGVEPGVTTTTASRSHES